MTLEELTAKVIKDLMKRAEAHDPNFATSVIDIEVVLTTVNDEETRMTITTFCTELSQYDNEYHIEETSVRVQEFRTDDPDDMDCTYDVTTVVE